MLLAYSFLSREDVPHLLLTSFSEKMTDLSHLSILAAYELFQKVMRYDTCSGLSHPLLLCGFKP